MSLRCFLGHRWGAWGLIKKTRLVDDWGDTIGSYSVYGSICTVCGVIGRKKIKT